MKIFRKIISVCSAVFSCYWLLVLFHAFLYQITSINLGTYSLHTAYSFSPISFLLALLLISLLGFAVCSMILAFKKREGDRTRRILLIWLLCNIILFLMLPPQSYTVSQYTILRMFSLIDTPAPFIIYHTGGVVALCTAISLIVPFKQKEVMQ